MKERTILHSDVNNFFASVETVSRPELKDKPVAVTGNPKKRTGIILAKNEIAKKYGVATGQAIWEAKVLCPDLVCLPPHYDLYEEISQKLASIYLEYTDFVEPLGLDECWLDVTDSLKYLGKTGKEIADELRHRIKEEFGITVSVGVSFSKLFAKLGSDMKKPDATTCIPKSKFKAMTYHLPLNVIVGIGRRLEKKFSKMNIKTIGDFVTLPDTFLKEVMGKTGLALKADLLGVRESLVQNYYTLPPPKSIGNGTTTIRDILTRAEIEKTIYFLAEKVSARMIRHGVLCQTLTISIKSNTLERTAKSQKIKPTQSVADLAKEGIKIADKLWKYNKPIRSIRLRASSLISDKAKQLSIFDKEKDYSHALDLVNKKYGKVFLASASSSFLNTAKHPQEDQ